MKLKGKTTPLYFLSSTLFLHGITLIAGIVTYRYVAPEYMGIWTTLTTLTVYTSFLRLGIPNGMNRELPFYLGKGEKEKAYSFAETTLSYSLFISLLLLIAGIVFSFFFDYAQYGDKSTYYKYALFAVVFKVICEPYTTYLSSTFRTNDSFDKLSNIQMIMSVLRLASVVFVVFWSFIGYLIRDAFLTAANMLLLQYWRPLPKIKPIFNKRVFMELLSVGLPIFAASYIVSFVDTFPRLLIINKGTALDMGLFSPVLMLFSLVALVPNTLTSYLYPKFSQAFGRGESFDFFWKKLKLIYGLSIVLALICGIAIYFLIDYVIQIFPKYVESVKYIKLSCIVLLFIGYKLGSALFVVFKTWKYLWAYSISYGLLSFVSLFLCSTFIKDLLVSVIVALFITYAMMYLLSIILTYRLKKSFIKG